MAFDAFLKVDGIPGGSTDDRHKEWIEVLSFNWGVSQPATPLSSEGKEQTTPTHQNFSIVKPVDNASARLFKACCLAELIKEVTLELCRATEKKEKYMSYKFTDVIVASWRPQGAPKGDQKFPSEEVAFSYREVELIYTETDPKTGRPKGDMKVAFNLATAKK